ncbi:hypothetical protein BB561_000582 [Smittium simulii]|uniref:Uncharacterized protein n=1 Tax=Smittium simulii TaxID=133385 RepID=A0A2T9YYG3_9FUNG|nr:hypothetical protein BB561_000582 [Smittium simulii]
MSANLNDSMSTTSTRNSSQIDFGSIYQGYPFNFDPSLLSGIEAASEVSYYGSNPDIIPINTQQTALASSSRILSSDSFYAALRQETDLVLTEPQLSQIAISENHLHNNLSIKPQESLFCSNQPSHTSHKASLQQNKGDSGDFLHVGIAHNNDNILSRPHPHLTDNNNLQTPRASMLNPSLSISNLNQHLLNMRITRLKRICIERKGRLDNLRNQVQVLVQQTLDPTSNVDINQDNKGNNNLSPYCSLSKATSSDKAYGRVNFIRQRRNTIQSINDEITVVSNKYLENLTELLALENEFVSLLY